MKKRILSAVSIVLLLAFMAPQALAAVVSKSDKYYVDDTAGVLSGNLQNEIVAANGDLEHYCKGAQIVVVTVQYLDGMKTDEYAMQLFNNWGVGDKTQNNGMLLLLATGEDKAWLTVGAGINNSFTDSMANSYFDKYFWNDFDKGNYETAVTNMLNALFSWYAKYYNVSLPANSSGASNGQYFAGGDVRTGYGYSILGSQMFWMILVVILIFAMSAVANDRRRYRSYYMFMGIPMPPYHFWYLWGGPHHHWHGPGGPGGPGGFGGGGFGGGGGGRGGGGGGRGGGGFGGFGGFGGGGFGGSGFGGGGFGGGGGGRS